MSDKMTAGLIESCAVITKVDIRRMVQKGQAKHSQIPGNDLRTIQEAEPKLYKVVR